MDEQTNNSASSGGNVGLYRRIAEGLERQPAYLLVFAVSALFVLSGVASAGAAVVQNNAWLGLIGLLSFAIALAAVVVVVRQVEGNIAEPTGADSQRARGAAPSTNVRLPAPTTPGEYPPVTTPRLGRAPTEVTEQQERQFLADFPEWSVVETEDQGARDGVRREFHRVYEFRTFSSTFKFMADTAQNVIEVIDHHPRWQNTYNRVEVWLTTFNLDFRLSSRDLRLARSIEEQWVVSLKEELNRRRGDPHNKAIQPTGEDASG